MNEINTQYELQPDPETGLNGEVHPNEAIEAHVDDLADAHEPGVYVLKLSSPATSDYETHAHLWLSEFETTPDYLEAIADTTDLFYVGAAKNVYQRIQEHLDTPNRTTAIANVFPIHSIHTIHWFNDPDQAFQQETRIAINLANTRMDAYVHSR